jgi:hypothetical protein
MPQSIRKRCHIGREAISVIVAFPVHPSASIAKVDAFPVHPSASIAKVDEFPVHPSASIAKVDAFPVHPSASIAKVDELPRPVCCFDHLPRSVPGTKPTSDPAR